MMPLHYMRHDRIEIVQVNSAVNCEDGAQFVYHTNYFVGMSGNGAVGTAQAP
jgi:hypothetical protein